ncbi:hypothetical protein JQX39_18280, partial [Marivita cryptomonadis]|nr:hypothetical protein [Marivita cryptomonadis]
MSGIGAIIDGAFKGYSFGEAVKDKKAARKIRDEELEWAREDRDYLKTKRGWEAEDRDVTVAERNRQIAARDEAERVHREAYETAQDEHATRGAPNPAELPGVTAAPVAPAAPGGTSPNPNQPLGRSMRAAPAPAAPRTGPAPMAPPSATPDTAPRSMAPGVVSTRSAPTQPAPMQPAPDQIPQSFLNDPTIQERLAQSTIPADRVWAHMNEETKQAWRDKDARRQTPQTPAQPIVPRSMTPPAPTDPNSGPTLGAAPALDAAPVIGQGADPRPRTSASPTAPAAPPYQPSKSSSVREVNPEASAFMQDIQRLMRNGDIEGALSKIEVGLATGKYGPAASPLARTAGAVGDYFTKSPSEGAAASDARRLSASALRWYQSPDAKEFFSQNPQALASAAQDPVGFLQQLASGQMPEQSSGIPVDPPSQAPAAPPYQPSKSSSVREVNPEASAFMQDIQRLMRNGDIEGALSKIEVGLATGKYGPAASPLARTAGAVGDYFTKSPSEGAAASDARRLSASALRWYQSPDAKEFFSQNPQALASAAQDPVGFLQQLASGQMPAQSSGIPVDPPSQAPA